jgi:hypothetical protein
MRSSTPGIGLRHYLAWACRSWKKPAANGASPTDTFSARRPAGQWSRGCAMEGILYTKNAGDLRVYCRALRWASISAATGAP